LSKDNIFRSFLLGVNYWPRHHGVKMWKEWNSEEIDSEFGEIKALGMNVVRVFLIWDDFQPILEIGTSEHTREIVMRHDESITSLDNPEMVDKDMVKKFDKLLSIADKHKLKLIVALMTGWMSGALLDISWRKDRNIFTDPFMIKWELLYCRYFAHRYKNNDTILSWEFGNEHNCFMKCPSPEAAWTWLRTISNELRINDPKHLISSGMHSLSSHPNNESPWGIKESGEVVDVLTVHPYPPFTPGCYMDKLTDMRANLHATTQSRYYSCLGGKPVLCEETGSLGNSTLSEESSADFIRLRLYSLFANGDIGCLWWCFSDFSQSKMIPYKWVQMENGLGLTSLDKRVKPAGEEFKRFGKVIDKIGGKLPQTSKKAAIVIMDVEDFWERYYNTFVLCKQAGIEADFIYAHDSFERYNLLICPSVCGHSNYNIVDWQRIMDYVKKGGFLYLSYDGGSITNLEEFFGIESADRLPFPESKTFMTSSNNCPHSLKGLELRCKIQDWHLEIKRHKAQTLLEWEDKTPAMLRYKYGKGKTIFLGLGVEAILSRTKYVSNDNNTYRIYEYLKEISKVAQELDISNPYVERTYHRVSENEGYLVLVNHKEDLIEVDVLCKTRPKSIMPIDKDIKSCVFDGSWRIKLQPFEGNIFNVVW